MSHFQELLKNGVFTIEQVTAELRNEGYIMEGRGRIGRVCTRILISEIASEFVACANGAGISIEDDFALFAIGTADGDPMGGHRYLVYDSERYTPKQAMTLLVTVNKAEKIIRELEEQTRLR